MKIGNCHLYLVHSEIFEENREHFVNGWVLLLFDEGVDLNVSHMKV